MIFVVINFLKKIECDDARGTRVEQHARNPRETQTRITRGTRAATATATATATAAAATATATTTATTTTTTTTRSINSRRGSRASAFRAGSARYTRLRFARVPRVLFSAGSACVVAFNFFQEINILQRILPLLLLTIYNSINFTINIISTTSAILLLLLHYYYYDYYYDYYHYYY